MNNTNPVVAGISLLCVAEHPCNEGNPTIDHARRAHEHREAEVERHEQEDYRCQVSVASIGLGLRRAEADQGAEVAREPLHGVGQLADDRPHRPQQHRARPAHIGDRRVRPVLQA